MGQDSTLSFIPIDMSVKGIGEDSNGRRTTFDIIGSNSASCGVSTLQWQQKGLFGSCYCGCVRYNVLSNIALLSATKKRRDHVPNMEVKNELTSSCYFIYTQEKSITNKSPGSEANNKRVGLPYTGRGTRRRSH